MLIKEFISVYARSSNITLIPTVNVIFPRKDGEDSVTCPIVSRQLFTVSDLKQWLCTEYNIPTCKQLLYSQSTPLMEDEELFDYFETILQCIDFHLYIFGSKNGEEKKIFEDLNVNVMQPINVYSTRNKTLLLTYCYEEGQFVQSLHNFIYQNLKIPQSSQRLFLNGGKISDEDNFVTMFISNKLVDVDGEFEVYLVVNGDKENLEIREDLKNDLDCIRTVTVMTSDDQQPLLEYPVHKTTAMRLKNEIYLEHQIPVMYQELRFKQKIISCFNDLDEIAFNGGKVQEVLVLNLLFSMFNEDGIVNFCTRFNLSILRNVTVQFLAGNFTIDAISEKLNSITDVKLYIQKHKSIPIRLQRIFFQKEEVKNITLFQLFPQQESPSIDTIVANLIVLPPKILKLKILSNYDFNTELEVGETSSILNVKEVLSNENGIIIDQIQLRSCLQLRILENSYGNVRCKKIQTFISRK